jgi:SAM-dependent MidA family methyltransferase
VSENPYVRVGEQDITAHVDFTTLARVGRDFGLEPAGFTDQEHFLLGLGIDRAMEGRDPQSPAFLALRRLIAHEGMGRTFKVLIQHKNVAPPPLEGLAYSPFFSQALWR